MTSLRPMERRRGNGVFSYPATSLPPLNSLNRFLLIFNSGVAISAHATTYP